ncbi:hypothetical protein COEREDRAFT_83782 [Coemansia reversa NRRL 1564]|uniref:Uncharacterized protein n=1 Tax=Coemansia reversa (strain ATCC 12441 / NRRL 1564) TaxID=763665 RepID=A0A2G5B1U3_COERN|nr:hypothetical protein COEREDRAFT_83782 [Coemansia reversa NRRL 1564]|eukprot:PIA12990.1 hypothetical protein COEREDRAFT_83782 [Coemansia reversa NRRL 1564]
MAQGHTELIRNKLVAIGTDAVGHAHQGIDAAAVESRQTVRELCQTADEAMALTQQHASAGVQAVQTVAEQALTEWRTARSSLVTLAQTQSVEREDAAEKLSRGVSTISEIFAEDSAANIASTTAAGSTPSPSRMYVGVDEWNITRSHSFIVDRLVADNSLLEESAQLDWTGELTSECHNSSCPNEEDCFMDVSVKNSEPHNIATPPPSANILANGSTPTHLEPLMMRKRSSENAVSPASDAASQPPARRPRIRNMRSSTELDESSPIVDSSSSSIPIPAPTRLPGPRRSRRTRG